MLSLQPAATLGEAIGRLDRLAPEATDGYDLELLIADIAPLISAWQLSGCWFWDEWPDREKVLPDAPPVDVGIDLVAQRIDGGWVAIQAKSRQLDEHGVGAPVASGEINKFLAAAGDKDIWAERWMVTNGAVELAGWAEGKDTMSGGPPMRVLNLAAVLREELASLASSDACPPSSKPAGDDAGRRQSRDEMQAEAVETAVSILTEHAQIDEPGIPRGEARGRIVLPCGTGKTRVALRIVERLTYPSELSVVLCPSIALVAQLRREFLAHAERPLRTMAVCSDRTVATDLDQEERIARNADDFTADRGAETTASLTGTVTTDPDKIADWIRQRRSDGNNNHVSIIFGTYQSARRLSEGISQAEAADAFKVLVCDEAHRTAGVRRKQRNTSETRKVRDFTLCHDRAAFPASYRVYQTATPRIYSDAARAKQHRAGWLVRDMDDQQTFGVDLYRRSYLDAVTYDWLSDYRIIGMGVGGDEALAIANRLVREADQNAAKEAADAEANGDAKAVKAARSRARGLPTTGDYLKGMAFALAVGGAARAPDGHSVPITSCIGFLNTVLRSRTMRTVLDSEAVRDWVAKQADGPRNGYQLEHLDASSPSSLRDEAKTRLKHNPTGSSHSVLNVGIFSEGTDAPSLSAVAFLEARRSPIDVVQAVGRAMRKAPGKQMGYIIVPVVFPQGVDAEEHLTHSDMHEGWQELGEILQALRAHDKRIEDALPEMLRIQAPSADQLRLELAETFVVTIAVPDSLQCQHLEAEVTGGIEEAQKIASDLISGKTTVSEHPQVRLLPDKYEDPDKEPNRHIAVAMNADGDRTDRVDATRRYAPKQGETKGRFNAAATRRNGRKMVNRQSGKDTLSDQERKRRREENAQKRAERERQRQAEDNEHHQKQINLLTSELGDQIAVNVLERSGLTADRTTRDLNLLRASVEEAARYLRSETALAAALNEHHGITALEANSTGNPRADGATVTALLWMNAAMLQQRIHKGRWLSGSIDALTDIKSHTAPHTRFQRSWQAITRQDFLPVIQPAIEALEAAIDTQRLAGLSRALRHLAAEAEQIAEVYADMGVDHAGVLFNKVMGDQASDGAFFTRPVAADLCARLAFDAIDPDNQLDWSDPAVWREHKTVDLACGSGTLLTAAMSEMKRRATAKGAKRKRLAELQKVAVEDVLKGLDINPISLQLAATQLMSGNTDVAYESMGLYQMPYGEQPDSIVAAGSVELLARAEIVTADVEYVTAPVQQRMNTERDRSKQVLTGLEDHEAALKHPDVNKAAKAVSDARIVIMNPPFTKWKEIGKKFTRNVQTRLRERMETLADHLTVADPLLSEFLGKNSLGPRFVALATLCLDSQIGVCATIIPTSALTNTSGLAERLELAKRFQIHTILTSHDPHNFALVQNSNLGESIVILKRHQGARPLTRIVSLDRLPRDEIEVTQLFGSFDTAVGAFADGWAGGGGGGVGRSVAMARRPHRRGRLERSDLAFSRAGRKRTTVWLTLRSSCDGFCWPVGTLDRPADTRARIRQRICRNARSFRLRQRCG